MRSEIIARDYSRYIVQHAAVHNQRTGQYLFNSLPQEVAACVTATPWDPFGRDMSQDQVETWLHNHIIFDSNGTIIALFADSVLLWEK